MRSINTRNILRTAVAVLMAGVISTAGMMAQSTIGTVVTLSGHVMDHSTLHAVDANYAIYDSHNKKVGRTRRASAKDGYLVTGLKPGETYRVRVEDPRYFKAEFEVAVPPTGKYVEMARDFVVHKLVSGKKLRISPAPFDLRKNHIKVGTEHRLEEFARMLIMNPGVKCDLIAYPDEDLPEGRAKQVSRERGAALKSFMEAAGVNTSRITVKEASTLDPLDPPPFRKGAKGHRYIGSVYLIITGV